MERIEKYVDKGVERLIKKLKSGATSGEVDLTGQNMNFASVRNLFIDGEFITLHLADSDCLCALLDDDRLLMLVYNFIDNWGGNINFRIVDNGNICTLQVLDNGGARIVSAYGDVIVETSPKENKKVDSVFLDDVLMQVGIEELDRRGTISIDREEARNDIVYDLIRFINESRGTDSFVSDYPENMDESHIDDLFFDSQRIIAVDEDNEIKLWAIINGERILSISSKPSENDSKLNSYTFELNRDTERYFVDRIFNSNTGKTYRAMRHRKGCNPNTIESRSIDKVIQPTSINQLMITGKGQYSK